ncbi:Bug family tripartite tricarboxylate transporter substrate binding protein [Roseomonas sp. CCTCC AB2023176]|uniref:Bug family tripartite tricarboxylate transporter substrate binding protein n=1 Tax=Roseomonas sp. CCTCC AB2023176 TaxID=3342640 RepID=UPI0035DEBF42
MHRRPILAGLAAALSATGARAQAPPPAFDHTLRIVVPNAPGGTSDILARLIAPELSRAIGQNVVVENRAGAAGNIGADAVAKSPPDGHTLLLLDVGALAINPSLFPRLPFDLARDLAPVTMLIFAPYVLAVRNGLPVTDAASLAAFARANPRGLNVANSGVGALNHLTAVEVAAHLGLNAVQVPYRGGAPALTAVAAGETDLIVNGATATLPFVTNGSMRGIAVSGEARLPAVPNLPTFRELGWPMADAGTWQGVLVQGATPRPVVERLAAELRGVLAMPAVASRVADLGGERRTEGPEALRAFLARATEEYGRTVRTHGIRPE